MNFNVIIIGGGAAGISAALWCDELNLTSLLLEAQNELGGQLLRVYNAIKNHLGIEAESGRELRDRFLKQTENYNFTIRLEAKVSEVDSENKTVSLINGEKISATAIIIATGVRRRKLNVEGEEIFKDKGILESGKRDQHLVKNKNVLVVGGGDAAFENALILAETARKVTLVHRRKDFRARKEFIEKVQGNPKIDVLSETILTKIIGANRVEAAALKSLKTSRINVLPIDAILIRIGVEPNTEILRGKLDLDENGYVKINSRCETSVKGVFAVGDVANPISPTVSSAVGMGATAAKAIFAELNPQQSL
ncbi:MAG: NAD(P)/FAD-dependent oxidoreductase [Acidobacteria bacterium]|nr:NAD(P)/FAD-dependent oxidoreductase [Acidobacteriota bacterium]MCA1638720.1 NAD(P)/FAD-dependent oxidoreductase [Acidobacteriota bacterium]